MLIIKAYFVGNGDRLPLNRSIRCAKKFPRNEKIDLIFPPIPVKCIAFAKSAVIKFPFYLMRIFNYFATRVTSNNKL